MLFSRGKNTLRMTEFLKLSIDDISDICHSLFAIHLPPMSLSIRNALSVNEEESSRTETVDDPCDE